MTRNREILLDNRPTGGAWVSNFRPVDSEVPPLQDGQVLVRNHYLSRDPCMRWCMNDARSGANSQPLGQVTQGGTVGEHLDIWPQALSEFAGLVASGKLRPRESVAPWLASAPEAFLEILKGRNFGRQLAKLI